MRVVVGILLLIHGFAHLVGFVVPWKLYADPKMPYKTTILAGRVEVGDVGIRIVGVVWLALAVVFFAAGAGALTLQPWWRWLALVAALGSFGFSLVEWPEARIGVLVNVAILAFLMLF